MARRIRLKGVFKHLFSNMERAFHEGKELSAAAVPDILRFPPFPFMSK